MIRKTLVVTLAVVSIGCLPARAETLKIGLLFKAMHHERWSKDRDEFIRQAEALGAEVIFRDSGGDPAAERRHFQEMVDAGARAIVIRPVSTRGDGTLTRMAHAAGVKVVGYDAVVLNERLDFMVMQDSWKVGELQARAFADWLRKRKGRVAGRLALIRGPAGDSNAGAMSSGVLELAAANPDVEIVADESHDGWSAEESRKTAERVLDRYGERIDGFLCNNSALARGVVAALDARGLTGDVFVAGADADLENIRLMVEGKQQAEIWKKIAPLAHRAAEVAVALSQGREPSADREIDNGYMKVPTVVTEVVLVTPETIDETVIAGGFHTREQVYGE